MNLFSTNERRINAFDPRDLRTLVLAPNSDNVISLPAQTSREIYPQYAALNPDKFQTIGFVICLGYSIVIPSSSMPLFPATTSWGLLINGGIIQPAFDWYAMAPINATVLSSKWNFIDLYTPAGDLKITWIPMPGLALGAYGKMSAMITYIPVNKYNISSRV